MVGSAQYTDEEIGWILNSVVSKAKPASIQHDFETQFGRTLNHNQVRYVKNKYGKDPRFNSPLVNTRPMKTIGAATSSALAQYRDTKETHRISSTKGSVFEHGSATVVSPSAAVPKRRRESDEDECHPGRPLQQRVKYQRFGSRAPTTVSGSSKSMGLVSSLMPPPLRKSPSIRLSDTCPRHFPFPSDSPCNSLFKDIDNITGGFGQLSDFQRSTYTPNQFREVGNIVGQLSRTSSFQQLTHVPPPILREVDDAIGQLSCSPTIQQSTHLGNFHLSSVGDFSSYTIQQDPYLTTIDLSQSMNSPATYASPYFGINSGLIQQHQSPSLPGLHQHMTAAYSPHQHGFSSPNSMIHDMQIQNFSPPQQTNSSYNHLYQPVYSMPGNTSHMDGQQHDSTDLSGPSLPEPFEAPPSETFPQMRPETVSDISYTGITAYNASDVERVLNQGQLDEGNQGTMPKLEATTSENMGNRKVMLNQGDLDLSTPTTTGFPDHLYRLNPLTPSNDLSSSTPGTTTVDPKLL